MKKDHTMNNQFKSNIYSIQFKETFKCEIKSLSIHGGDSDKEIKVDLRKNKNLMTKPILTGLTSVCGQYGISYFIDIFAEWEFP